MSAKLRELRCNQTLKLIGTDISVLCLRRFRLFEGFSLLSWFEVFETDSNIVVPGLDRDFLDVYVVSNSKPT